MTSGYPQKQAFLKYKMKEKGMIKTVKHAKTWQRQVKERNGKSERGFRTLFN